MNRIVIIGSPGSGKSTIANKIGEKLGHPVIHLDKEYWEGDTERFTKEEWNKHEERLIADELWIIDGNYQRTLETRLGRANVIVFVDAPKLVCLWRAIKRLLFQKDKKRHGNRDKIDWKLVNFIIKYPREKNLALLEKYKDKDIYILRNKKDIVEFLEKVS